MAESTSKVALGKAIPKSVSAAFLGMGLLCLVQSSIFLSASINNLIYHSLPTHYCLKVADL